MELVVKQCKDSWNQIAISYFVNFNILIFLTFQSLLLAYNVIYKAQSVCISIKNGRFFETQTWFMYILTCIFQNKTKWTTNIEF